MSETVDCPYCSSADPAVAEALGTCPHCGRPMASGRSKPEPSFTRADSFDAHPTEARYGETPVTSTAKPLEHDAHEVLAYVVGLLDVVSSALDYILKDPARAAVLGFMTGSEPLDWLLRRRAGHLLEGRIAHVRGLRHKQGGANPDAELYAQLDRWVDAGVHHILLIDEVVSGTQLRTALLRIRDWYSASHMDRRVAVHLLGVGEEQRVEPDDQTWMTKHVLRDSVQDHSSGLLVDTRLVKVPALLGKDRKGQPLKDVVLNESGEYSVERTWPGGYAIRCPNWMSINGGATLEVVWSAASLDQIFGVAIYAVCGFGYVSEYRWPQTILSAGCSECRSLLMAARAKAKVIAGRTDPPERVSGCLFESPERLASRLVDEGGQPLRPTNE